MSGGVFLPAHHVLQPECRPCRHDEGRQPVHDHVWRADADPRGLFPPVGAFFSTLPDCVLGGCTVIMFGAIIVSGVTMLGECGFDQRNTIIAATSFAIGIGVTQVPEFFSGMPQIISDIFAGNPVAGVFVVAMILSLTLPKKVKIEEVGALTEETLERKPDETN